MLFTFVITRDKSSVILSTVLPGHMPHASVSACRSQWREAVTWLSLPAHSELLKGNAVFVSVSSSSQTKAFPQKREKSYFLNSRWTASEISSCYIIVLALKEKKQNPPNNTDQTGFLFFISSSIMAVGSSISAALLLARSALTIVTSSLLAQYL